MKDLMVVALVFALLCFTVNAKHKSEQQAEYVILFDTGSSRTRMLIYQFPESGKSLKAPDVKELDPSPSKI